MTSESPYRLAVPDAQLELIQKKLALATFPDELEDAGWEYGVPLADLKRLVGRWKDGFDWRKEEAAINNELPQFTRDIAVDGHGTLDIHYVHGKSSVPGAIPLLFVHGWPGNFLEVRKILPLLIAKTADAPSFHVVALSLPGYGPSQAPKLKGFGLAQYAELCNKLMLSLGYNEYVTQGGDWGFRITRKIGTLYGGQTIKAWHTNFPSVSSKPEGLPESDAALTAFEAAGNERTKWFEEKGRGYAAEHSTQPQTLGYGLADSPIALLAWIREKLHNWTDDYPWTDDEVLIWVSIYLFSHAGPAASLRIYYEVAQGNEREIPKSDVPTIPMGISCFPKELVVVPRSWTRTLGNVVFESEHAHGGHFAAHEKPVELVNDVRAMFAKGGPAYGVIEGKTGY